MISKSKDTFVIKRDTFSYHCKMSSYCTYFSMVEASAQCLLLVGKATISTYLHSVGHNATLMLVNPYESYRLPISYRMHVSFAIKAITNVKGL